MTTAIDGVSNERAEYINGLRAFANLLENNLDLPMPTHGGGRYNPLQWLLFNHPEQNQKDDAALIVRAIPGPWEKGTLTDEMFRASGSVCGLFLEVIVKRDVVCKRTVVGTKKVTKKVVVKTRDEVVDEEIVEWDCGSLLSPALPAGRPELASR